MMWPFRFVARQVRRLFKLAVYASIFTVAVILLDALLSPDEPESRDAAM